jgi:hypothetical protein
METLISIPSLSGSRLLAAFDWSSFCFFQASLSAGISEEGNFFPLLREESSGSGSRFN